MNAVPGATGTSSSNNLGYTVKINNTGLTISNYNTTNVVSSILLSNDGMYLATWAIQLQATGAPTDIFSNIAYNNISGTSNAGGLGYSNWGMTRIGNILYGSSGSYIIQGQAGYYCNLIMTVDGGSGFSTPSISYNLTRLS